MSAARKGDGAWLALAFPAAMLATFFAAPFALMIAVSVFERVQGGFYEPGFTLAHYARFLTAFFGEVLGFSLGLSALTAAVCVAVGLPFAWTLARLGRRAQIMWLVALLSALSLSEVVIGFAWSTLLSRTGGVTNLLAAVGLMEPQALTPSFGAVLLGMVYLTFPYAVLVLFPTLARLDPALTEAARTMGASPLRAFVDVVLPATRRAALAGFIMAFVFALGIYLLPQLLGRPRDWTLSVLITDQAIYQSNLPFAAAMAVFLVVVSLSLVGLAIFAERKA